MPNNKIILMASLRENGLSERESIIYLTILEFPNQSAYQISKRIGISRTWVYKPLQSLIDQWWVIENLGLRATMKYRAIDPSEVINIKKAQREKLKNMLPNLMLLQWNQKDKPRVSYFPWKEWVVHVYRDMMASREPTRPVLGILWTMYMDEELEYYLNHAFDGERDAIDDFDARMIISSNNTSLYAEKNRVLWPHIMIDDDEFIISNEILISWGNKVAMLLFESWEVWWVLIQSRSLHKTLMWLHNLIRKLYHKKEK